MDQTDYQKALESTHKQWIKAALEAHKGSQVKAAEWLGITRVTLRARIDRYGIAPKASKNVRNGKIKAKE